MEALEIQDWPPLGQEIVPVEQQPILKVQQTHDSYLRQGNGSWEGNASTMSLGLHYLKDPMLSTAVFL